MAIDRAEVRRRVRTITAWTAAGAAAVTAGLAFGAARGNHVARATTPATRTAPAAPQTAVPQDPGTSGFTPPAASTAPPAGMSGGS